MNHFVGAGQCRKHLWVHALRIYITRTSIAGLYSRSLSLQDLRNRCKRMDAAGDEEDQAAELEKTAHQVRDHVSLTHQ